VAVHGLRRRLRSATLESVPLLGRQGAVLDLRRLIEAIPRRRATARSVGCVRRPVDRPHRRRLRALRRRRRVTATPAADRIASLMTITYVDTRDVPFVELTRSRTASALRGSRSTWPGPAARRTTTTPQRPRLRPGRPDRRQLCEVSVDQADVNAAAHSYQRPHDPAE
jgi:hypothetical protein